MNESYMDWLRTRPKFKPLKKWNPYLIDKIIERYPCEDNNYLSGFISRVITGAPGNGKSMYAYKFMAKLDYVMNGYTKVDEEENSYKFAIDNMIYRPDDFFNRIKKQIDIGQPFIIWTLDDASIHMGKQIWDTDRDVYRELQDRLPVIRDYVTCLLITTITIKLLAKPFREFFDKKINITLEEGFVRFPRRGKHYIKEYYPDDIRFRVYHPYDDKFSCLVPQPFYSWYREKKNNALKEYNRIRDEHKKNLEQEDEPESDDEPDF